MTASSVTSEPAQAHDMRPQLLRGLSLLDSVLLLVGGIVGSAIFLTAKDIAAPLPNPLLFVGVWILGGIITMFAGLSFAELGAMFPDSGGQYVYMREAYGDLVAFLYGWMIFTVSNGGTIAALAVAFAEYLGAIFPGVSKERVMFTVVGFGFTRVHAIALLAIALVTWTNMVGLRKGAILQNVATWMKFAAVAAFVTLGFAFGKGAWSHFGESGAAAGAHAAGLTMGLTPWQLVSAFGVGLIAVFWAYDGWVYITWVSGEVKDPQRNIPRGLILGIVTVGVIYIALNLIYLYALPLREIAQETTIAHAAAKAMFSHAAADWLSAMIAVSCFGAMASCILSGGRVYFAMARDGVFFRRMAEVHPRWRTPAFSLVGQGIWAAVLALSGRYDQLYTYVMFMMVVSYVAGVAALFILRRKQPDRPRPYRCTGYPWVPAAYLVLGSVFAINTAVERPKETLAGIGIVLVGVPFYIFWRRRNGAVVSSQ